MSLTKDKNKIIEENQVVKEEKCKVRLILHNHSSRICVDSNLRQTHSETQARFIWAKTGGYVTSPSEKKAVFFS